MNEINQKNCVSIGDMKKRVLSFNKEFKKSESTRDEMQDLLKKLSNVSIKKQFLSDSFKKNINDEIQLLKNKLEVYEHDALFSFFAEVVHYIWKHPEKKEKLIVTAKIQRGYSDQELKYSFDGELGDLLQNAVIPFNEFGLIWFIDYENKIQKLDENSSWNEFCVFFLKHFCDDPESFKAAFNKFK